MHPTKIVLFGEAERGDFFAAHHCSTLAQLLDTCGNPPPFSKGIFYAVQALLFKKELLFFRVKEEGYSYQDYFRAIKLIGSHTSWGPFAALCAPGVGDQMIIEALHPLMARYHCILITNEADLYDYLMSHSPQSA